MNKKFSTLLAAALVAGSMSSSAFAKDVMPAGQRYYQLVSSNKALTYASKDGKDSLVVKATADLIDDLEAYEKSLWSVKAEGTNYVFTNRVLGTTLSISTTGVTKTKDAAAYLGSGIAAFAGVKGSNELLIDDADFSPAAGSNTIQLYSNIPATDLTKKDSVYYLSIGTGANADIIRVNKDEKATSATTFTLTSASQSFDLTADELNALGNKAFKLSFADMAGKEITTTLDNPFISWMTAVPSPILTSGAAFANYTNLTDAIGEPKDGTTTPASGIYQATEAIAAYKTAYDAYVTFVNKWIGTKAEADNEKLTNATGYTAVKEKLFKNTAPLGAADVLLSSTELAKVGAIITEAEKLEKAKTGDVIDAVAAALYNANVTVVGAINTQLYSVATNVAALNSNLASLIVVDQKKTGTEFKGLDAYKAAEKAAKAIDDMKTTCSSTVQGYFGSGFATLLGNITVTAAVDGDGSYVTLQNADGKYIAVDTTYIAEADKHLGFKLEKDSKKIFGFPYTASFKITQTLDDPNMDRLVLTTYAFEAPTTKDTYKEEYEDGAYTWDPSAVTITPTASDAEVVIRTLGKVGSYRKEVSVDITNTESALRDNAFISFAEPETASLTAGMYYIYNATTDKEKKDLAAISMKAGASASFANALKSNYVSEYVPATQWNVSIMEDGQFNFVNREYKDSVLCRLFDVEGKEGLYTNLAKDTIRVEKVEITAADAAHVGYKYYTPELLKIATFSLNMRVLNQPTDFYVYMNKDSVLMADATDGAKALKLVSLDGKAGTKRELKDANLSATTYQLVAMDEDGETPLYMSAKANNTVVLSTTKSTQTVELKATKEGLYTIVWGADKFDKTSVTEKVFTVNQDGFIILTAMDAPNNYRFNLVEENTPEYWDMTEANGTKDSIFNISFGSKLKNILLGVDENNILITRDLNELSLATDTASVGFTLDTAFVNRTNNYRPAYYISQNRVELENDSIQANYLYVATDSMKNGSKEGKKAYSYNNYARLAMTPAIHIGDKMLLGAEKKEATAAQLNNFNFAFKKIKDTDYSDGYMIEGSLNNNKATGALAVINTIPVMAEASMGEVFTNVVGGGAVNNEDLNATSIKVTTDKGTVTIAGAQGKKVVISDLLGRVLVSTDLTSDNAVISVPAGYITVAVEGEAAVKAIVR